MSALKLEVNESTLSRLRHRAEREGVSVDELAARLLDEASEQDPFEFIGSIHRGPLFAERADEALAKSGFGQPRS